MKLVKKTQEKNTNERAPGGSRENEVAEPTCLFPLSYRFLSSTYVCFLSRRDMMDYFSSVKKIDI